MSHTIELEFIDDIAEENEGVGDAGIETYKDEPYAGVARESAQNSADAWKTKPVKMSFDVLEIDRKDIPSFEKFAGTVDICFNQAKSEKDGKGMAFLKRVKEILKSKSIHVLRVADFNTNGLKGPCEKGTAFHSLVKSTGISKKDRETSGGSYGIGKNAAFAVSELHTVFYSSQYKDSKGNLQFIAQGKSLLVSHKDENGKAKKGKGYWGLPRFQAVTDINKVPVWLRRKEQGASIYSLGFNQPDDWDYIIAASLLSNFFEAIHSGEMEFSVNNNQIVINKKNLPSLFDNPQIRKAAAKNNIEERLDFAKDLYRCSVSSDTREQIFKIDLLGKVSFKILVEEGLPKRLALVRNGMIITDSFEHFGDKFARFARLSKDFIAIVEAQEDKGNELIKNLENSRHDGLSAAHITDPDKREEAIDAMRMLRSKIREAIEEETVTTIDDEVTVDELSEFFADENSRDYLADPNNPEDLERMASRPMEVNTSSTLRKKQRKKRINNPHPGNDNISVLPITDVRNIIVKAGKKELRRIFFISPSTCESRIIIQAAGINESEELTPVSVKAATIEDNQILMKVKEGQKISFDVEFADNYNGPIEVFAYKRLAEI